MLEDFQAEFVADLFTGRKVNWLILPEGNGKSTLIAAIALHHLEHRGPVPEVDIAAASREQAEVLFGQAAGFVSRSTRLKRVFKVRDGYREIRLVGRPIQHHIKVWAADEKTADGVMPTLAILEELHRQKNMGLYRVWTGKLGKRNGQLAAISTAGEPGSEFEQTRTQMRESAPDVQRKTCFVRAIAPGFVLHDWHVPEKADVENLEVVKNANPLSTITIESLRAKRATPGLTHAHWRRFTGNLPTRSDDAAITEIEWARAATADRIPVGERIDVGFDVAWKHDTTAIVPLWVAPDGRRVLGPAAVLVPPRDGTSLHPDEVKRAFLAIDGRNPITSVSMDMTDAEDIAAWLRDELNVTVIDHSQGNAQAALDYVRFMDGLRNRTLQHSGDAALTRHAMNAVARMLPAGDVRFDRSSSTRQGGNQDARVIDALVAAAMVNNDTAAPVEDDYAELRAS